MPGILSHEQKQLAFRLRARGWRLVDIAREVGCSAPMVGLMVRDGRFTSGMPDDWEPRPGCLSIADREEILVGLRTGQSLSAIARKIQRSASTVSREVAANGGRESYSAWSAHQRARVGARRPKPCKLRAGRLCDEVGRRLLELWSPDVIARRLPLDFPDDPEMRVSHETIYQSLFVQGRGELRRELARCLRSGRTCRKKRGAVDRRGRIPAMVNISQRPAEVADRAVPGHWEGDLILGEGSRSAVGTLVERTTRLVLLLHLGNDRSAVNVEGETTCTPWTPMRRSPQRARCAGLAVATAPPARTGSVPSIETAGETDAKPNSRPWRASATTPGKTSGSLPDAGASGSA